MVEIDTKRLISDIKQLEYDIKSGAMIALGRVCWDKIHQLNWPRSPLEMEISKELMWTIRNLPDLNELTRLYSLLAHSRGLLHMERIDGSTFYHLTRGDCWTYFKGESVLDRKRLIFEWTFRDQCILVEPVIYRYIA